MELTPWLEIEPLGPAEHARLRRRAIFECCKWDPQVEDVSTVAPFPLLLRRGSWQEIADLSERLAAEAVAAEEELAARPELHGLLGLPRSVRRVLRAVRSQGAARGMARVLRFDFHWTREGWRISEANTDVPGGFNEGSGFARLLAPSFPGSEPAGDPAGALAEAVAGETPPGSRVALIHATAYTDDRQVMEFLAKELEARDRRAVLAAPDHLRWRDGRAWLRSGWIHAGDTAVSAIVRFFPAEWLPNLPRACGWELFFRGSRTPVSNPATALLTQSKRFPLVWDRLKTPLPAWRRLLPETRDPREANWKRDPEAWVLKPALGRVGDGIGLSGATPEKEWKQIRRELRFGSRWWAAQRKFEAVPMAVGGETFFPCIGVYTIAGRAAGAYGRLARRPIVNHLAQDAAVLIEPPRHEEAFHGRLAAL